jgi:RNA polymerase sigma factor (sigma-70 family)
VSHDRFDELFRELYLPAFAVARRILGDDQESEDAASEALARTAASWRRVKDLPYQRAWVLRVTANVSTDMVRRRHRRSRDRALGPAVDREPDIDGRLELAISLAKLPRRQREVLVLRYLADFTEEQVAEALCISLGTVKQHGSRGLRAMRRELGPMMGATVVS